VPVQLDKRSLRDQVVGLIREGILTGVYEPGQRLSEPELARNLNVSLTPVREALGVLAGSGLVVRSGRRGTRVRELSSADIENLLAVREALEVLAVRQAVPHLTPEDDTRFNELLKEQQRATELALNEPSSALPLLVHVNEAFHALIVERTRNQWLESMLASIQDLLGFARARLRARATLDRRQQSLAEHRRIAIALRRRDGDAAVLAMRSHITRLKLDLIALAPDLDRVRTGAAAGSPERRGRRLSPAKRGSPSSDEPRAGPGGPTTS
jgi:DNA-binding GntR family transcriptional regulator